MAQQLRASGHRLFFYSRYVRGVPERTMEIDFLVVRAYDDAALRPRVSPVEVKSTKSYRTSSLDRFRALYGDWLAGHSGHSGDRPQSAQSLPKSGGSSGTGANDPRPR